MTLADIVCVIDYFDEEQSQPANYVVQLREGLYEAHCWDEHAADYERVIGIFISVKAAIRAVHHAGDYIRRNDLVDL